MSGKKDFKVVKDEVKEEVVAETKADIVKEIAEATKKGEKIQAFCKSEAFNTLSYAEKRLISERFNCLASYIDCLTAQASIKEEK